MSQLAQRVLTAIPLLIGLLLLLFVAPLRVAVWVTAAVMVLGAFEWAAFIGLRSFPARAACGAGMALLLAGAGWLVPEVVSLPLLLWAALVWWAIALLWILRYPTAIPPVAAAVSGVLVLVPSWLAMVAILRVPSQGPALALLALSIIFAADIGAYFAGRRFGRDPSGRFGDSGLCGDQHSQPVCIADGSSHRDHHGASASLYDHAGSSFGHCADSGAGDCRLCGN